jgi:hypothetical protein
MQGEFNFIIQENYGCDFFFLLLELENMFITLGDSTLRAYNTQYEKMK